MTPKPQGMNRITPHSYVEQSGSEQPSHSQRLVANPAAGTRQRILGAAADLFERKGYAGTSVREIVEASGSTKPSLYYYFGSKEGLYSELLESCERQMSHLLDETERVMGTPPAKIESLCLGLSRLIRRNACFVRLIEVHSLDPSQFPFLGTTTLIRARLNAVLGRLLEEGRREGLFHFEHVEDVQCIILGILLMARQPGGRGTGRAVPLSTLPRMLRVTLKGIGCESNAPNPSHTGSNHRGRQE